MGFFSLKATCCLCEKSVGLNRYRLADKKEHWICRNCFKKCGFKWNTPLDRLTVSNCELQMKVYHTLYEGKNIRK